jgi:hypothetical protein
VADGIRHRRHHRHVVGEDQNKDPKDMLSIATARHFIFLSPAKTKNGLTRGTFVHFLPARLHPLTHHLSHLKQACKVSTTSNKQW